MYGIRQCLAILANVERLTIVPPVFSQRSIRQMPVPRNLSYALQISAEGPEAGLAVKNLR